MCIVCIIMCIVVRHTAPISAHVYCCCARHYFHLSTPGEDTFTKSGGKPPSGAFIRAP